MEKNHIPGIDSHPRNLREILPLGAQARYFLTIIHLSQLPVIHQNPARDLEIGLYHNIVPRQDLVQSVMEDIIPRRGF